MIQQLWRRLFAIDVFRYAIAGGSAAIVELAGFALLLAFSVSIELAAVLSFFVALIVNYTLSSLIVFKRTIDLVRFAKFAAGALVGMAINISITIWIGQMFPDFAIAAKLCGITTAFFYNFMINKYVIFRN